MVKKRSVGDSAPLHRRAHKHIRHHYFRLMPDKKHHRIMIWVAFFVSAGIIAAQLLYPPERAVPLARLGTENVAGKTDVELSQHITQSFQAKKLRIHVGKDTAEYSLAETGAEPTAESMALRLTDYPFWQRFIPLSILWQVPHVDTLTMTYSNTVLEQFVAESQKRFAIAPINAGVAIKNGKLVATMDTAGRKVEAEAIKQALLDASIAYDGVVDLTIPSESVPASKQSDDIQDVAAQAQAALSRQVTIEVGGKTFTPDVDTIASWLTLSETKTGRTVLELQTKGLDAYVAELNKSVGVAAGQTNIQLQNGVEVSRESGKVGKRVDDASLKTSLEAYLLRGEGTGTMSIPLVEVAPQVIYNRRYTATESGLRAYVKDAAREQNANIVIEQLSNSYWTASANANLSTVSASTYKLYVALYLFDQMNQGKIHWDDSMLDTTVSGCFDRMTIASTNPCAEQWLSDFGRSNVNQFTWKHGFSHGTTFTDPMAVHTTAGDLATYMVGLERGTLISGAQRDRLLHSLSSHPYRWGVPSGSGGQVYDKVGFLWDYVHDAAIVRHPKGTYVIVVMTKGRSYATIATITREVEKILYP